MRTVHIRDLRRIEKLLDTAESILANFHRSWIEDATACVDEACSKIEDARDDLLKIIENKNAQN